MRPALVATMLALALPARAAEKHAMAVYHFNIQYVAGGLTGFPDGESADPKFDLDEKQIEDAIVVESFEPLLDIYLRHPAWGADFEMQGYMLDVLRERHPAILAKLRTLVDRGQVAVPSFHWSDQLWVAYPRRDQEKSFELTRQSAEMAGIPLAKSVWTQEGQFGPGQARFMKERGLEVAILPRNLFKWLHPGERIEPLYRFGEVLCVVTSGAANEHVETAWAFVDDGELAVTDRANPYFGIHFKYNAAAAAEFEKKLVDLEAAGWKHSTVEDFAARALELGGEPPALPAMVDGTWQPDDTLNVARWMGGAGLFYSIGSEVDNAVLAGNARVGQRLRSAEAIVDALVAEDPGDVDLIGPLVGDLRTAWRELLLAEVSDSTGWNPFVGERRYSLGHQANAEAAVKRILEHEDVAPRLAPARPAPKLKPAAGMEASETTDPDRPVTTWTLAPEGDGPVAITVTGHPRRRPIATWNQREGADLWELSVAFDGAPKGQWPVTIAFPREHDRAVFSASLDDEAITDLALADLGAEVLAIPLANGLVGLGDGTFLVKDTATMHIAAQLPKAERVVRFEDATAPEEPFTWRFVLVRGTPAQALAEANALNVAPEYTLAAPSCGCAGQVASWPAMGVVLAAFARSRRRR